MKTSVKLKLQIGFGVILMFLLIISAISMLFLHNNQKTLAEIEQKQEQVNYYQDIAFQAVRANAAIRGYMLYEKEEMKDNHYEIREALHASLDELKKTTKDNADFTAYLTQLEEWQNGIDNEIIPLMATNPERAHEIALPILGEGSRLLVSFGKSMASEATDEIHQVIQETNDKGRANFTLMLILSIIALITSFTISTFFGQRINNNIQQVMDKMQNFAAGDFFTTLNLRTKDEFEQLSNSFNSMTEKLRFTMKQVGDSAEQVAATSEQLTASSQEVNYATETVTMSIQDISNGIDQQNQMTTDANQLADNVIEEMQSISSHIREMNDSTNKTKNLTSEGQRSVENIREQMTIVSSNTNTLTTDVAELDANTTLITDAVSVIRGIAEQTNLLAINASIEAARSGEHGKGFAVVATEVRKLADESNRAAIDIEHMVDTITAHTEKIVEGIKVNEASVTTGIERVNIASESFATIDESIETVQQQTVQVTTAIEQITHNIDQLVHNIGDIHEVSQNTTENVQSVAASSEEQLAAMEEVAAASTHLANMAIELQETIQAFKY